MAGMDDLVVTSLRGGLDETTPPHMLAADCCTVAMNVEHFHASLGERRQGMEAVSMTASSLDDETGIVHLSEFFPTGLVTLAELWGVAATPGTSVSVARRNTGAWNVVTPDDAIVTTAPNIYKILTQMLNAKLFMAYPCATDRNHVWDQTNLRRTGLKQPNPPTAANGGGAGFATARWYRVRYVVVVGGIVKLRSEPSTSLAFTPAGANDVIVTKPATITEHETHWEVEASTSANGDYYRIARVVVGTATYDDVADPATYATIGVLSEAIGAYLLQPNCKYLSVDGSRILWGGHFTDDTKKSQIGWGLKSTDPGVGNDERFPIVDTGGTPIITNRDLNPTEGGEITGISKAVNGVWFSFKWNQIHRHAPTGDEVTGAYDDYTVSKQHGAIEGTVVDGMDELGRGCAYFIDPQFGPSRIGQFGLQVLYGLRTTWRRVNSLASKVIGRGVYYQDKQQVIWVVAADTNDAPTLGIRLQVSEVVSAEGVAKRGWSLFDGDIAKAYALTTLHEVVTGDPDPLVKALRARPFGGYLGPNFVQRWDVGTTDNGVAFHAQMRTRPFFPTGLQQKWAGVQATLLAATNLMLSVVVRLIPDFGNTALGAGVDGEDMVTTDLFPQTSEPVTLKDFDDLHVAEARSIMIEFSDP